MTKQIGDTLIIEHEPERECEECGKQAETRPYGVGGKQICIDCGNADIEVVTRRMNEMFYKMGIKSMIKNFDD